ncbi:MAG TPA: hypothetical protein VMJ10_26915 [Kofleriaceae bacterium]|nr:hypothetical protein [Kofleriaceae bacterium]
MADDDAVRAKLAALEAEVKADADAQRARKEAALAKLREQKAAQQAERERQLAVVARKKKPEPERELDPEPEPESDEGLGGALELASRANKVKNELARKPTKGQKSWIVSSVASLVLGPVGWLYAGSLREAIPATAGWLVLATIASKILPTFLLMPVLLVVMPLSAIAGLVYALQYNRHGGRQRLFDKDKDKPKKQLRGG